MIHIGIDPGKEGALVVILEDGNVLKFPTPKIGKEYDKARMFSILKDLTTQYPSCHAVLENINGHSALGRSGAFMMGLGKGLWEMAIMSLKIPHTFVSPQSWQKEVWKGVPVQYKPSKSENRAVKDTKATSLVAVSRLFPHVDLRASERSKNPHDGIVDALLMAEYSRRIYSF
jgi:hypothetical protein